MGPWLFGKVPLGSSKESEVGDTRSCKSPGWWWPGSSPIYNLLAQSAEPLSRAMQDTCPISTRHLGPTP